MRTSKFKGMNNVKEKKEGLSEPDVILNAHVMNDGSLEKREGGEKKADLPGAHSLWTDQKGTILCMAKGCLYKLVDGTPVLLKDTGQPDAATSYLSLSGLVYISNAGFTGVYDTSTGEVGQWGMNLPEAPVIIPVSGGLPEGEYNLCFTVTGKNGRPSGNGRISKITLEENSGIKIANIPENGTVWMTAPNGSQMYYAGTTPVITELNETAEPIPTMWGSPPPPLSNLCYAHGRVWGSNGTKVFYSEPFQPELFRLSDSYFEMDDYIGIIAKTSSGLYVGCRKKTYFFHGKNPEEMVQYEAGNGVVFGSLCYASTLSNLGKNVPVWLGVDGVFAGSTEGKVVNLVKEQVKIDPEQDKGASIYRVKDGQTRMLFSYKQKGQNIGIGDNATCEVVRNGTVLQNP